MPRDGNIMAEAIRRFQADKERRAAQLERRTEEIYRRVPAGEALCPPPLATAARGGPGGVCAVSFSHLTASPRVCGSWFSGAAAVWLSIDA